MPIDRRSQKLGQLIIGVLLGLSLCPYGGLAQSTPTKTEESAKVPPAEAKPEAVTQAEKPKEFDLRTTKFLTGDWGGTRTDLEKQGITLQLTYQQHMHSNLHGGIDTNNGFATSGSYDLALEFDFDKMKLVPGGSFYIKAAGTWSELRTTFDIEKIGGLSRTINDEGDDYAIFVDKWWWRQRLFDARLEFRLGRINSAKDLFDVSDIAGSEDKQFQNSTLVVNPTIPHRNGIGAYANVWPVDWLYARVATVDAQSQPRQTGFNTAFHDEDLFMAIGEVGVTPKFESAKGKLAGTYRWGSWFNPLPRNRFQDSLGGALAPRVESNDFGFYFGFDQMVWKETADTKDKQGLSIFGRYGFAHGDVNRVESFWSTGLQYAGLIPTRDKDIVAFGVGQQILSDDLRNATRPRADRETVYEVYYAYEVTPWFVITPSLEFLTNTGGDEDGPDTAVANIRFRFVF